MTTGDEMRPVRVDRRPREHRTYHRFKAEVDHFPAWPKGVPYA